jgi:diacylglycerol kinase
MKRFISSVKDAGRGLVYVFKKERNFRIQTAFAIAVIFIIFLFPLKVWEIIVIILLTVMVLTMELFNTALEHFTDLFKPRVHPYVGIIKDIMAAAVLMTSLGAVIIGLIILWPHFVSLIK